jgi:predicted metal-dependent hydrolase
MTDRVSDPLGERSPYLVEGIRLFGAGEYLPAHETLEEYWADAPASERPFLQGLIQLATGFHHLVRGGTVGARLQFTKALDRLSGYPDRYEGIDIAGIRLFLGDALLRLDSGEPITPPALE